MGTSYVYRWGGKDAPQRAQKWQLKCKATIAETTLPLATLPIVGSTCHNCNAPHAIAKMIC